LKGAELTVLGQVEDNHCQSHANGFHFVWIATEVGADTCPYRIENLSKHLELGGFKRCAEDRDARYRHGGSATFASAKTTASISASGLHGLGTTMPLRQALPMCA
jgi:hypothetical protein